MGLAHEFAGATGHSRDDCRWLGYRFDEEVGFRPEQADCWVGTSTRDRIESTMVQRGWLTAIHETPSKTWLSDSAGRIYEYPDKSLSGARTTHPLSGVLRGVWGLSDELVFTWGTLRGEPVAYAWDGGEWRQVQTPGHLIAVHGADPGLVFGVGQQGLIARWDGTGFASVTSPTDGTLSGVFVASGGEMYACGADGELLAGTGQEWRLQVRHEAALACVAKWNGTVYAGGPGGLYALRDGALHLVRDSFRPLSFDARGDLLIATPTHLVSTCDGVVFGGRTVAGFARLSVRKRPGWR